MVYEGLLDPVGPLPVGVDASFVAPGLGIAERGDESFVARGVSDLGLSLAEVEVVDEALEEGRSPSSSSKATWVCRTNMPKNDSYFKPLV